MPSSKAAPKRAQSALAENAKTIIYAVLIAVTVRTVAFEPFNIPSGSMIPTLLVGDYLFVSKYTYGYSKHSMPLSPDLFSGRILGSEPKRGDIAVFKLPSDGSTDYIKRVIGLPGDKVQMVQGRLFINGQLVPREPVQKIRTRDAFGRDVEVPTYKETLPGGVSHLIIERDGDTGYYDNTKEYVVPAGHYFMMGDNRDNSDDSREAVGYVPAENLEGKALFRFFSTDGSARLWEVWKWPFSIRYSRILTLVK